LTENRFIRVKKPNLHQIILDLCRIDGASQLNNLFKYADDKSMMITNFTLEPALVGAVIHGSNDCIQLILDRCRKMTFRDVPINIRKPLELAILGNKTDIVKMLLTYKTVKLSDKIIDQLHLLEVDLFRYLFEMGVIGRIQYQTIFNNCCCTDLEKAKIMYQHMTSDSECRIDVKQAFGHSVLSNISEIPIWIYTTCPDVIGIGYSNLLLALRMLTSEKMVNFKWFISINPKMMIKNIISRLSFQQVINKCCQYCDLETVQWIIESNNDDAIGIMSAGSHIVHNKQHGPEIMHYVSKSVPGTHWNLYMQQACGNNNLGMIKWIHANHGEHCEKVINMSKLFKIDCIDTIEFLFRSGYTPSLLHYDMYYLPEPILLLMLKYGLVPKDSLERLLLRGISINQYRLVETIFPLLSEPIDPAILNRNMYCLNTMEMMSVIIRMVPDLPRDMFKYKEFLLPDVCKLLFDNKFQLDDNNMKLLRTNKIDIVGRLTEQLIPELANIVYLYM
jgi:hypothetical protein